MAAPKHIQEKAAQLEKALARVAKLSAEIEDWVANKTDYETGSQFFYEARLDIPYEFDLRETLSMLDEIAENGEW